MNAATCTTEIAASAFGLAFCKGNQAFFQHQAWLGSERIETSASGGVANRVGELVFGDHSNLGRGLDDYQFAGMDTDLETDSHHAQYRQYDSIAGRWMSPDPYDGSYDPSNPQSFNRYSYALNDPLSMTDPSGMNGDNPISLGGAVGGCAGAAMSEGGNVFADIGCGLSIFKDILGLFGGPSFHGSLHPRPAGTGNPQWDGNFGESLGISTKIRMGSWGIAQALGLPDAGCEFGACGGGIDYFQQGNGPSVSKAWSLAKAFSQVAWYSFLASQNIHAPYADPSDPNHRLFGTHYCGPGGGGTITSPTDNACYLHDKCYTDNGFSPIDNFNPFLSISQGHKLQGCNQALCDATAPINNGAATAIGGYFTGTGIYHCSTY